MITPSSNLCVPLFSLPSQKGKKTVRGLYREQKQKYLTDTRRNCHPCGFHLVKTNKKRTGTAKKLSLSLPPPHFPLLSLSLSLFPQLSLSFSLYREPGTGHHAWKQLTIFSCLQVFSPKLRVFWFWLAGFFVFELRLFRFFRFRAEDAWFFLNSRLLLFSIFRSPWYCIAFYKL